LRTSTKTLILSVPLLVLGLGIGAPARAQLQPWQLTGEQLLLAGGDGSLAPEFKDPKRPELQVEVSASRASAFLIGAASYTLGDKWCKDGPFSGKEVEAVYRALIDLPQQRLEQESGAKLAVEVLGKLYPCK
jgi:hypothetical protein